ncbi:MAG: DivIVA domain-containing protein [Actinomycetota bacterium]|nr:DivIVA domain-containing protein [Actinomycetota bacterium]
MPITPEEIAGKQFFPSTDGYDKDEVRAFLEVVAADQRALLERIESLLGKGDASDTGAEVGAVLQKAAELSERMTRQAEEKALETRKRLEEESDMLRKATAEATSRLRQEAEQYSYEVRVAAERAAREQQLEAADRIGRLLAGESTVRERLYALETTLQAMRGDLREAAEAVLPEIKQITPPMPPLPKAKRSSSAPVIDLRDDPPVGASRSGTARTNGSFRT